jgi:AcrR family transcriptional regulator
VVVYAGQGEPRRVMPLLWRTPTEEETRPGPKPALTVDGIIAAAIDIADERGMAGLSMRTVGERVGRTGMALYTYVPGKGDIVDLMYDAVLVEMHRTYDLSVGWRAALTAWAQDLWEFYLRHPWVLSVSQARPVLGPNEYVVLDTVLGILFEAGLTAVRTRQFTGALWQFIRGVAMVVAEAREAARSTGTSDDEWWEARAPLLAEVAPDFDVRFPMVARLAQAGEVSPSEEDDGPYVERSAAESFRVGLGALLDGIEMDLARG